ncbi:hypothetical protein PRIPAC_89133 [Pristionchus pacificus]|uniref:START domain-containing protein n=1 Tax=Pristionchus pacificus TaxID=54126 RepID=A0A2A6B702_PRIPA|nr:hypothetical protein PRIPAC_89133 [Pristionchus pacificus]|eukprot:PDM61644.1 hypothetical protein PRIPAC_51086 [Pristionchus pacificus]
MLCIVVFVLFIISACECFNTHTDSWREERQVCNYSNALKEAESALVDAHKLFASQSFESREGWKKEGKHSAFSIHSKSTLKTNLTVALMVLEGNIDQVKREIWDRIEELPKWNSIVNSRYTMVFRSVNLPEIPERKDKLRANLHLAALRLRPNPSNAGKILCDLAVSVDLKGNLPKDVVKSMMPSIMAIVADLMITHFKELGDHDYLDNIIKRDKEAARRNLIILTDPVISVETQLHSLPMAKQHVHDFTSRAVRVKNKHPNSAYSFTGHSDEIVCGMKRPILHPDSPIHEIILPLSQPIRQGPLEIARIEGFGPAMPTLQIDP